VELPTQLLAVLKFVQASPLLVQGVNRSGVMMEPGGLFQFGTKPLEMALLPAGQPAYVSKEGLGTRFWE
jgi:hypothetical protein